MQWMVAAHGAFCFAQTGAQSLFLESSSAVDRARDLDEPVKSKARAESQPCWISF